MIFRTRYRLRYRVVRALHSVADEGFVKCNVGDQCFHSFIHFLFESDLLSIRITKIEIEIQKYKWK